MKKNIKYLFLFAFALLLASPAFAMQCKSGNYEASDECWTNVRVSPLETTPVTVGTVLIYDFTDDNTDDAAFQVRVSGAVTDSYRVAGVAQKTIATGDYGLIKVRGKGKIKSIGALSSADRLFVSATAGRVVNATSTDNTSAASHDRPIAFALGASATNATADAFIVVV